MSDHREFTQDDGGKRDRTSIPGWNTLHHLRVWNKDLARHFLASVSVLWTHQPSGAESQLRQT